MKIKMGAVCVGIPDFRNVDLCELSWKESLNSDGHQFYKYQQNEQSPVTVTELTNTKKNTTYDVGNPSSGFEEENVAGLNQ
jgi:hypothetical protein